MPVTRLWRWAPAAAMLLVSLISYIDRNTLALLAPTILKETGLNAAEYGLVISAFSIAYMLGNPLWGRAVDRVGVRWGMVAAVSLWTAASASHALAAGLAGFAAARALLGLGEGATFPGGLRTVTQTLEPNQWGRGLAVAYSGGSLGALITPLLITPVALAWGWRGAFLFTGLVGAAWVMLWLVISRRPDLRVRPPAEDPAGQAARPRFGEARLWSFLAAYALGASPIGFVIYGGAIFLAQHLGRSQAEIGRLLWIPPLGWELGYFFWGALADRLCRGRLGPLRALRCLMTAAMLAALPLALAPQLASLTLVMADLFLGMFVAAGFIILSMGYATRVYSAAHSGLIAGLGAGAWSAGVALLMPVFGRLIDLRAWDAAFRLAALLPAAGWALWVIVNRRGSDQAAELKRQ